VTTNRNNAFVFPRLPRVLRFMAITGVVAGLAFIDLPRVTARPTPTPRPRRTPCGPPGPRVWDVTVGQGFTFVPNRLDIIEGDTVCWTWASNGHSVTSGINCIANGWFCSPDGTNCSQGILSDTGTTYCITFPGYGSFYYFCAAHCAMGMTGVINVSLRPRPCP
jgi:plastocyanin